MNLLSCSYQLLEQNTLDMALYAKTIADCHNQLHKANHSWLQPGPDNDSWTKIKRLATEINACSTALLCLGVGGSYICARAGWQMLAPTAQAATSLLWGGWNSSLRYHQQLLNQLAQEQDISVCVISKQGASAETLTAFNLAKDYLRQRYGAGWHKRVYVITAYGSPLQREAEQNGYSLLTIQPDIPGRYSALTAVGLLPAAVAGLDIRSILAGANQAAAELNNGDIYANPCYQYVASSFFAHKTLGKQVELFSSTEPCMEFFIRWLKQLFAESEVKQGRGIFPADFLYSSDLHTMGQFLANDAPLCFETLICPPQAALADNALPGYVKLEQSLCTLLSSRKDHILHRINLAALDETCLGYAFFFFMKAAAMRALLFGSNPFDQPAVDSFKQQLNGLCTYEA